eukprot:m.182011 g.182011  ORF g.182011 m.182011 type:complete len:458 (+) comp17452_c0_seq1:1836-3209(+)
MAGGGGGADACELALGLLETRLQIRVALHSSVLGLQGLHQVTLEGFEACRSIGRIEPVVQLAVQTTTPAVAVGFASAATAATAVAVRLFRCCSRRRSHLLAERGNLRLQIQAGASVGLLAVLQLLAGSSKISTQRLRHLALCNKFQVLALHARVLAALELTVFPPLGLQIILEFAEVLVLVCEDGVLALELLLQGRHLRAQLLDLAAGGVLLGEELLDLARLGQGYLLQVGDARAQAAELLVLLVDALAEGLGKAGLGLDVQLVQLVLLARSPRRRVLLLLEGELQLLLALRHVLVGEHQVRELGFVAHILTRALAQEHEELGPRHLLHPRLLGSNVIMVSTVLQVLCGCRWRRRACCGHCVAVGVKVVRIWRGRHRDYGASGAGAGEAVIGATGGGGGSVVIVITAGAIVAVAVITASGGVGGRQHGGGYLEEAADLGLQLAFEPFEHAEKRSAVP